jgi:hypothetical protein
MSTPAAQQVVPLGSLLSIAEQIQMLGQTQKTGEIRVVGRDDVSITVVNGDVTDARSGKLEGLPAVIDLINQHALSTEFVVGKTSARRTINLPYLELLYEAARHRDEASFGATTNINPTDIPDLVQLKPGIRPPPSPPISARPGANGNGAASAARPGVAAGASHAPRPAPAPAEPEGGPDSISGLKLLVEFEGRTVPFFLKNGISAIGRAPDNDLNLPEPSVSNRHAFIAVESKVVIIRDLGSTNGTFVNGARIESCQLKVGDRVVFGRVVASLIEL